MVLKILMAGLTVICFGITMEIPKKFILFSGMSGAAGWATYLICKQMGRGVVFSTFIAAFVITLLSQVGARKLKSPVTVFLITGILPLVPGAGMYNIVYYLLHDNRSTAADYFFQTIMTAGSIALAIFIVDSAYRIITGQRRHLRELHYISKDKEKQ